MSPKYLLVLAVAILLFADEVASRKKCKTYCNEHCHDSHRYKKCKTRHDECGYKPDECDFTVSKSVMNTTIKIAELGLPNKNISLVSVQIQQNCSECSLGQINVWLLYKNGTITIECNCPEAVGCIFVVLCFVLQHVAVLLG